MRCKYQEEIQAEWGKENQGFGPNVKYNKKITLGQQLTAYPRFKMNHVNYPYEYSYE